MQMIQAVAGHGSQPDPMRVYAHDLRNLFAVVASAKFLLERPHDDSRLSVILDALGRVASDGKLTTDALLSREFSGRASGTDATNQLDELAPLLNVLERPGLTIDLQVAPEPAWVLMPSSELSAILIELVTNATRAGASRIGIRSVRRGDRYWLVVADNGCGFANDKMLSAKSVRAGLHGSGLRRVAAAVAAARGKLKIRSRAGHATVVAIVLPTVRVVGTNEPVRHQGLIGRLYGQRTA